jgi:thioredoxin 1
VATLDVDANNQTPYKFGVRGVPTVILFDKGKVVAQKVGLPRKADLTTMIEERVG